MDPQARFLAVPTIDALPQDGSRAGIGGQIKGANGLGSLHYGVLGAG